jgi:hypothetical protein
VRPVLGAEVKFFGRHRNGMIRDGVLRLVVPLTPPSIEAMAKSPGLSKRISFSLNLAALAT